MGFKLYSEEFKKKVVDAYESGMMIKEVADMYNVSKSSVSCWVKGIKPCERKLFTVEQKKEFVKYRIKNNVSYDEMAEKIGIMQDTLRNWESTYFFAVMEEIDREKRKVKKRRKKTYNGTWNFVGTGGYWS